MKENEKTNREQRTIKKTFQILDRVSKKKAVILMAALFTGIAGKAIYNYSADSSSDEEEKDS